MVQGLCWRPISGRTFPFLPGSRKLSASRMLSGRRSRYEFQVVTVSIFRCSRFSANLLGRHAPLAMISVDAPAVNPFCRGAHLDRLKRFFAFDVHHTTLAREVVAGLTTFTTMSYIVLVNPALLAAAGIPEGPSFVATVLVGAIGCYLMAFYANRPFAIAPYMGENAFVAFTVCRALGFAWQTALAAIFIAGVLFVLMTVFRLRQWVVDGVPISLRYSFAVGIGFFLTFIGLNATGLVVVGVTGAPVQAGHLTSPPALVAMAGFVLLAVLTIRRFPGAILAGIIITAIVAFIAGTSPAPKHLVSMPPSLAPVFWQLDFRGALSWRAFPVVLTIFIMAFVDTMGTLIGLSARAGFLDENGQLP